MSRKNTNELQNLQDIETTINRMAFDSIWTGSSSEALIGTLRSIMQKVSIEKNKLNRYFGAVNLLEVYKQNKEKIRSLKAALFLTPDTKENAGRRAELAAQIEELTAKNEEIRAEIESVMNSITPIGSEVDQIAYSVSFNYAANINKLLDLYQGRLTLKERNSVQRILQQLNDKDSLAHYYDQVDSNGNVIPGSGLKYIENVISSIQSTYTGREAVVNTTLALLQLAADKGVKLSYDHNPNLYTTPYISTEEIVSGIRCNGWASWCVDKGTPGGFQWRYGNAFKYVGERIPKENWTLVQPGDVFSNEEHVGVIISNDPINHKFIVAHASTWNEGIMLEEKDYDELSLKDYCIQDMTNVYNGTEYTNLPKWKNYAQTHDKSVI